MIVMVMMKKATWMVGGRGIEGKDCLHRCNISFPPISIEPSGEVGIGPGDSVLGEILDMVILDILCELGNTR